jgi:hypothetical protein
MQKRSLKETIIHGFVGGVFNGLGLTVGIAIVAYILSLFVDSVATFPVIGDFLANIVNATLTSLKNK